MIMQDKLEVFTMSPETNNSEGKPDSEDPSKFITEYDSNEIMLDSRSINTNANINMDDDKKLATNKDTINNEEDEQSVFHDRPIVCILEEPLRRSSTVSTTTTKRRRCRMFRVIRSKGKALASGGFGVTVVTSSNGEENDTSAEYLFMEEVLFLHERGLARALMSTSATRVEEVDDVDQNKSIIDDIVTSLDTSQLYQLLPIMGISLAVYRVYSHLRQQDFRVLRHDPNRYGILCRQQKHQEDKRKRQQEYQNDQQQQQQQQQQLNEEEEEKDCNTEQDSDSLPHKTNRKQSLRIRHQVRDSIQNAEPPSIPFPGVNSNGEDNKDDGSNSHKDDVDKILLCWDAYNPNSNFGKTHPGKPNFYVAATYYNVPIVRFSDLKALIRERCNGIPLKVATVSDSGT
jgi:hypothetical protein